LNYKLLTLKKLAEKGQRGDGVALQYKLMADAGYANHKADFIQASGINNNP